MQKLLKRTAQAEKQAARRIKKRNDLVKNSAQRQDFKKRMAAVRQANRSLAGARQRRREDWELGPLAPLRDTPLQDDNGAYWGTMALNRTMSELPDKQIQLACKWAGGKKYLCLKGGDRVAIMQGPDKGKIGTVRSISMEEGCVVLEGDHLQHNFTISEFLTETTEAGFIQVAPLRVPIQAVRLVHPLQDPKTRKFRDVIINELAPREIFHDKPTGRTTWRRVVPGLNVHIPWPRAFKEEDRNETTKTHTDHECDTLQIDVEESTFVPRLLTPGMPAEVIDELRNKYSKFRTRHEPEYIAKKEAEERAKVARRRGISVEMMTPLQELNRKIKEEKRQRPVPELTDAMLERIGQLMLRNAHRAPALNKVLKELALKAPLEANMPMLKAKMPTPKAPSEAKMTLQTLLAPGAAPKGEAPPPS